MKNYNFENQNTKAFYHLAWIGFAVSLLGMVIGLVYMDMEIQMKAFIGMTYLFSISSCFTVAKVIRDKHDNEKLLSIIEKNDHID